MNATRVSTRAGRRSGLTITLLLLTILRPVKGAEIVITTTGIVDVGWDSYPAPGMFEVGLPIKGVKGQRDLAGQAFTLVFTFDDAKGRPMPTVGCPHSGSGIAGEFAISPGTAVLTIAGKSHTFGLAKRSHSGASRTIAAACSQSEIGFEIHEGEGFDVTAIASIRIFPAKGKGSLTQNPDWRAPLTLTVMEDNGSGIHIHDYHHEVRASLVTKSLTIGPKTK